MSLQLFWLTGKAKLLHFTWANKLNFSHKVIQNQSIFISWLSWINERTVVYFYSCLFEVPGLRVKVEESICVLVSRISQPLLLFCCYCHNSRLCVHLIFPFCFLFFKLEVDTQVIIEQDQHAVIWWVTKDSAKQIGSKMKSSQSGTFLTFFVFCLHRSHLILDGSENVMTVIFIFSNKFSDACLFDSPPCLRSGGRGGPCVWILSAPGCDPCAEFCRRRSGRGVPRTGAPRSQPDAWLVVSWLKTQWIQQGRKSPELATGSAVFCYFQGKWLEGVTHSAIGPMPG